MYINPIGLRFDVAEVETGYAVCVLEEDGSPVMRVTKPMEYAYESDLLLRLLNEAESGNGFAQLSLAHLREAKIVEPLAVRG